MKRKLRKSKRRSKRRSKKKLGRNFGKILTFDEIKKKLENLTTIPVAGQILNLQDKLKETMDNLKIPENPKDPNSKLVDAISDYYRPIVLATMINYFIHPETLDYVMLKYAKRYADISEPNLKTINRVTKGQNPNLAFIAHHWINTKTKITIDEFEKEYINNLGFFKRMEIDNIPLLLYLAKSYWKGYESLEPIIHSSLIDYIIHPETLDYVMNKYYPDRPKPYITENIQRKLFLYIPMLMIIVGILLLYKNTIKEKIRKMKVKQSISKLSLKNL